MKSWPFVVVGLLSALASITLLRWPHVFIAFDRRLNSRYILFMNGFEPGSTLHRQFYRSIGLRAAIGSGICFIVALLDEFGWLSFAPKSHALSWTGPALTAISPINFGIVFVAVLISLACVYVPGFVVPFKGAWPIIGMVCFAVAGISIQFKVVSPVYLFAGAVVLTGYWIQQINSGCMGGITVFAPVLAALWIAPVLQLNGHVVEAKVTLMVCTLAAAVLSLIFSIRPRLMEKVDGS